MDENNIDRTIYLATGASEIAGASFFGFQGYKIGERINLVYEITNPIAETLINISPTLVSGAAGFITSGLAALVISCSISDNLKPLNLDSSSQIEQITLEQYENETS
jgi:hypothetical protein